MNDTNTVKMLPLEDYMPRISIGGHANDVFDYPGDTERLVLEQHHSSREHVIVKCESWEDGSNIEDTRTIRGTVLVRRSHLRAALEALEAMEACDPVTTNALGHAITPAPC